METNDNERRQNLTKKDELSLIKYIKDSIETLVQILAEEKINEYNDKKENTPQEYEILLIKLEKEIRGHIQTENQVKLYAETLQNSIEELENENKMLKEKLKIEENINTNISSNTNDVTKDKILVLKS